MKKQTQSPYAKHDIFEGDATIFKMQRSGDIWQFRIWLKKERKYFIKSLKTNNYDVATEKAKQLTLDLLHDIKIGKKLYGITLQKLVELYIDARLKDIDIRHGITKGRVKTIKSQLQHILNIIGAKKRVSSLDPKCIEDYIYLRKKSHNAETYTAKNEICTINHMMTWGYNEGHCYFPKFIFKKVTMKNNDIGRRDVFTDEEYKELCRYMRTWSSAKECTTYENLIDRNHRDKKTGQLCKGNLVYNKDLHLERLMVRDYILISANTGMRTGEARQLTWGDIERIEKHEDFDTGEMQLLAKINIRWTTSKVRKSREFLARGGEYFVRLKERQKHTEDDDLVFSMDGKKSLTVQNWSKHWKSLMDGLGIQYIKEYVFDENGEYVLDENDDAITTGRSITYYSLRHYFISCRVKSSVAVVDISKMTGTSVRHITETYLHYEEEQSRTAALKTYTKKDGIIVPTNSLTKQKQSFKYGEEQEVLRSRYLH